MSGSGHDWLSNMLSSFHDSPVDISITRVNYVGKGVESHVNYDDVWNLPFAILSASTSAKAAIGLVETAK